MKGAVEIKVFGDKVILDEGELQSAFAPILDECELTVICDRTFNSGGRCGKLAAVRHSHLVLLYGLSVGQGNRLCEAARRLLHQRSHTAGTPVGPTPGGERAGSPGGPNPTPIRGVPRRGAKGGQGTEGAHEEEDRHQP